MQNASPAPLHLLSNPPAQPVAMALVKLVQTGSATVEVRTLQNGYFAAEVAAGAVTVTADPPEDKQDQYSTSPATQVSATKGQVTKVDGTTTGAPPTVRIADFWPWNVGNKSIQDSTGWHDDHGGWYAGWESDHHLCWWNVIIGTTSVGGQTAYVLFCPYGNPAAVSAMDVDSPQPLGGESVILRPGSDGSVTMYGQCWVVRNQDDTYEVIGYMYDTPIIWPVMSLGKEYTGTTTVQQRTINIDLAPNLSLADLDDPGPDVRRGFFEPCPQSVTWTQRLTGIGVPVSTPAGSFTDTMVLSLMVEETYNGNIITSNVQIILARDIGWIAECGLHTSRPVGQPSGTGDVIGQYYDLLHYARVNGAEWGTLPPSHMIGR